MRREFTKDDWRVFLSSVGLRGDLIVVYMEYVARLYSNRVPVIFEFRHLARLLGRTPRYLASAVNRSRNHYRMFDIPKRRGGKRQITAPYPALLECQQWIMRHILVRTRVHRAVHGFVTGRSIKSNAEEHVSKKCCLKMDLADFFPSIKLPRVIRVFRTLGYSPNVSYYLAQLCCFEEALPQGAATSPALSNTIAFKMDNRLHNLAKKCKLTYTRYADDLAFSGDKIGIGFSRLVTRIAEEEGFAVRNDKTQLSRKHGKRVITGISVQGDRMRPPREFRRAIQQEVHYILKYGYQSHTSKLKIRNPFYIDSVLGRLLYWKWIEPDNGRVAEWCNALQSMAAARFD